MGEIAAQQMESKYFVWEPGSFQLGLRRIRPTKETAVAPERLANWVQNSRLACISQVSAHTPILFAVPTPPKPAKRRRSDSHALSYSGEASLTELPRYSTSPISSQHAATRLDRWLRHCRFVRFGSCRRPSVPDDFDYLDSPDWVEYFLCARWS